MKQNLAAYKPLFLETARVYLQSLAKDIHILTENSQDTHMINNCYISAHSLKSQSAVMGFPKMEDACRLLEKIFHDIKEGILPMTNELISPLVATITKLQTSVDRIEKEDEENDLSEDIKKLEQAITITNT